MSALLEMLVTAALVSGAGVLCLKLLPHAPPRVRFRIALAALAAWVVPWPTLSLPVERPGPSVLAEWRETLHAALPRRLPAADDVRAPLAAAADGLRAPPAAAADGVGALAVSADAPLRAAAEGYASLANAGGASGSPLPHVPIGYVLALLFLPGTLRLLADASALRSSLAAWRASSRSGEALRGALPPELGHVRASIRIVPGSAIAATSGWLRPVVWLGDRLCASDREVALVHELCHVQRRDPLWVTFVTAVRRAYWWNPAVAWLCREAVLAMEADCDRRCAGWLGGCRYTESLASMMLDAAAPRAPRLVAAARTPSLNVRRLKLLQTPQPLMGLRDYLLIAVTAFAGAACAGYAAARPAASIALDPALPQASAEQARPEWSRVAVPDTPAGAALEALLGAFNAGDSERLAAQLGAFTPQELEFDVPRSSGGLDLIALVVSEPLRIEFTSQDRADGTRRHGQLEIDARDRTRIATLEMHEVASAHSL